MHVYIYVYVCVCVSVNIYEYYIKLWGPGGSILVKMRLSR